MISINKFPSKLNREIDSSKLLGNIDFKFCPSCNNRLIKDNICCDKCNYKFNNAEYDSESKYFLNKMIEIISFFGKGYNLEDTASEVGISSEDIIFWIELGYNGSEFYLDFYNNIIKFFPDIFNEIKSNILFRFKINQDLYYEINDFLSKANDFDENYKINKYQKNLPLLAKWKDEELSFNQIIYNDLVFWCYNLVSYSGSFNSENYKFMEYYFNLNSKFIDNLNNNMMGMSAYSIPLSIYLCLEIDEFKQDLKLTNMIFSLFKKVGNEIMNYCNKTDDNIFEYYTKFIDNIDEYINNNSSN